MDTGTPQSGPSDFWVAMRRRERVVELEARVAELSEALEDVETEGERMKRAYGLPEKEGE